MQSNNISCCYKTMFLIVINTMDNTMHILNENRILSRSINVSKAKYYSKKQYTSSSPANRADFYCKRYAHLYL